MNALAQHILQQNLNEVDTMNQLQAAHIISDNCVSATDVWEGDEGLARLWLIDAYYPGRLMEKQGVML